MTRAQVQPLELDTRIRYEIHHEIANGEHEDTSGEGVIISSLYDSEKIGPWWRYEVSASGVPILFDHYPFEEYRDITEVDSYDIKQVFGDDQQWHFYLPGDRDKRKELAQKYNVTKNTICDISLRKTWKEGKEE